MKTMYFPLVTENDRALPYYFYAIGNNYPQESVERPGSAHQWSFGYYQWIQTRRGTGNFISNGKSMTVSEGQGIFLLPNLPHKYFAVDSEWLVDWIIFDGRLIGDFVKNELGISEPGVFYIDSPHIITQKLIKLYDVSTAQAPMTALSCSTVVYDILVQLKKSLSEHSKASIKTRSQLLEPVLRCIDEHFNEDLSLDILAEKAGVTPQYLCSVFRQVTSYTPFEYVNLVRIHKAKELMRSEPDIRIDEAARRSGFRSSSYFCMVFRRFEKITPAQFRDDGRDG